MTEMRCIGEKLAMNHPKDSHPEKNPDRNGTAGKEYTILLTFFTILFVVSGTILGVRLYQDRKTEQDFAALKELIRPSSTAGPQQEQQSDLPNYQARFSELLQINPDIIGWISIEGTNLNYPVMYKPESKDYYLKHGFDGKDSIYGVPYLDENCRFSQEEQSDNLILYGHNMKTGTIFGCLTEYANPEMYTEHPDICFETLYGDKIYRIFAAFAIDIEKDTFPYNTYIELNPEQFETYINELKSRSDVDTDLTPSYGDALLTLSTCEYTHYNGRYVVCAYAEKD